MEMCMSKVAEKRAESPGPEQSTELAEPPQVVKVVKARGGKRCLLTAFGDKTYARERTPDGGAGSLVLPPLRLDGQDEAMAGDENVSMQMAVGGGGPTGGFVKKKCKRSRQKNRGQRQAMAKFDRRLAADDASGS
jgi:hypothetical protein